MKSVASTITAVQIEGNLIAPDITSLVLTGSIKGQAPEDFGFAKTDKLADEIATAWGDAKAYWVAFQRALLRLDADDPATTITREWAVPLLRSLGYDPVYTAKAEVVEGQTYAISHRAEPGENQPPIHIIGCRVKVDRRPPSGTPRLSAHALVQEYLNKTEHLWAIATNGLRWRLLRDSSLMTRLTYIEFDLEQILSGENFAEFGLFYRLFHRSRLPQGMDDADKCLLEYYHQEALQQGGRVRDRLRDGVEKALLQLGTGFLQHPSNEHLRQKLADGKELTDVGYYRQLLRLIYRLLFLMVAESRNLLLIGEDREKEQIYREYYSIERLRELAERPNWRREGFQDLWQGLWVTFLLFDENWRGRLLGLSPLNGDLFGSDTLPDLGDCAIDNHDLLVAIRYLSLYQDKGQLRRVNYGALDVEELGSVYESLLDFHPQIVQKQGIYQFALVFGSDRKTTGSYYTPPQLVQQLIKTALEPVIEAKLQEARQGEFPTPNSQLQTTQEKALLSLKIVDPACGSGHFLLAAARRIGKELAKVRTQEAEPGSEPLKLAIRDVIQNCIYGVDLNPLAVDLCKVALWIEGFPGKLPLNFLDHRIKCGNSLVGVLDLDCLKEGIPDEAYKAVTGDDKKLSSQFKKQNKKERENKDQLSLFGDLEPERTQYAESWRELGEIPETTPQEVKDKEKRYQETRKNQRWWQDYSACNLWTAAFFMPLTEQNLQLLPTTAALTQLLRGNTSTQEIVEAANKLAQEKHFFHWCLEFPEVFEAGGFDCVLGNPPWELLQLEEQEFFAVRSPEIAKLSGENRKQAIKQLSQVDRELAQTFENAKHNADAQNKFLRESGRFPLTATGKINTYSVFSEMVHKILALPNGHAGIIIPSAIATSDTAKSFFDFIATNGHLSTLLDFAEIRDYFPGVGSPDPFCLFVIRARQSLDNPSEFIFKMLKLSEASNPLRRISLLPSDFRLLNPNTKNCPVFRTNSDAIVTKIIYRRFPIIENESTGTNPWNISLRQGLFNMTSSSNLFIKTPINGSLPLYEAKMIYHFDHRFGSYELRGDERGFATLPATSLANYQNPEYQISPFYWIAESEVDSRISKIWNKNWLIVFRGVTKALNERTAICTAIPKSGVGNSLSLIFLQNISCKLIGCFIGNFNSLVFDFVTRQKISGVNLNTFIVKQLPILPPTAYTPENIEFISSRVLELVYTAWDMQPFAKDMGYDGEPFIWNPNRRALLRAELDTYYAKLYGLTRDELRYILDPADVYGEDFPSETFRVLKNNEIKQFGEYRTQRLVLEAWDRMFG